MQLDAEALGTYYSRVIPKGFAEDALCPYGEKPNWDGKVYRRAKFGDVSRAWRRTLIAMW
jgi:hypothetical protein